MPPSRVIVIGASAGGIEAVSVVIAGLTPELRAAVLVVIHTSRGEDGLVTVLARAAPVPVLPAKDGSTLADAHVYVARPDRHLAVQDGVMRVVMGPSQHGFRPAVDVLFHSAAESAGHRAAGVILSGALSDGVSGLRAIKQAGGRAVVQNPEQAQFPSMPLAALREVEVDAVLPLGEIAADLARWARREPPRPAASAPRLQPAALRELVERRTPGRYESLIPISCPSCGGALAQTHERESLEYACHVGHRYNGESLLSALDGRVDSVLWSALRALQEKALLRRRMHESAGSRSLESLAARWLDEAEQAERQAELVRRLIETVPAPSSLAPSGPLPAVAPEGDADRRAGRSRTSSESGRNGGGRRRSQSAGRSGRPRRDGGRERPAPGGEPGGATVRPRAARSPRSERGGGLGASGHGGRARARPDAGSSRNGGGRQRRANGGEPAEPGRGRAPATKRAGSESSRRH